MNTSLSALQDKRLLPFIYSATKLNTFTSSHSRLGSNLAVVAKAFDVSRMGDELEEHFHISYINP